MFADISRENLILAFNKLSFIVRKECISNSGSINAIPRNSPYSLHVMKILPVHIVSIQSNTQSHTIEMSQKSIYIDCNEDDTFKLCPQAPLTGRGG